MDRDRDHLDASLPFLTRTPRLFTSLSTEFALEICAICSPSLNTSAHPGQHGDQRRCCLASTCRRICPLHWAYRAPQNSESPNEYFNDGTCHFGSPLIPKKRRPQEALTLLSKQYVNLHTIAHESTTGFVPCPTRLLQVIILQKYFRGSCCLAMDLRISSPTCSSTSACLLSRK